MYTVPPSRVLVYNEYCRCCYLQIDLFSLCLQDDNRTVKNICVVNPSVPTINLTDAVVHRVLHPLAINGNCLFKR